MIQNNISPFLNRAAPIEPSIFPLMPTPVTQNEEVTSPDGSVILAMQTKTEVDGSVTYSFFTQTTAQEDRQLIFTSPGMKGEFSLSPNSWSPDNAYLFVMQRKNNLVNALVFKVVEDTAENQNQLIDILSIFEKAPGDYTITDVTGWDAPTLLHVKTETKGTMKKGPKYWFDLTGNTFIQVY